MFYIYRENSKIEKDIIILRTGNLLLNLYSSLNISPDTELDKAYIKLSPYDNKLVRGDFKAQVG